MCVRERERERGKKRKKEGEGERERLRESLDTKRLSNLKRDSDDVMSATGIVVAEAPKRVDALFD